MIFTLNKISSFVSDNMLREYSLISISFSLLFSVFILGNKGYHTIIKVILLATYFILFITILGLFLNFPYINISNLYFSSIQYNYKTIEFGKTLKIFDRSLFKSKV